MKTLLLILLTSFGINTFAQNYPYPPVDGYGDNYGYYDDDNSEYFPEDYYYQYPNDYYTDSFYRDSYNDYRNSISMINWNRFFIDYRLAPWQIDQIIYLNQLFNSYKRWNAYYRFNPDRWYYDRYYALQNILGSEVFIVFSNTYYRGLNPVVYYRDYRRRHYSPRIYVRPMYRQVNINIYRISPKMYHRDYGYYYRPNKGFGFKNAPRMGSNQGFDGNNNGFRSNKGFRNSQNQENDNGFRDSSSSYRGDRINQNQNQNQNDGFRGQRNQDSYSNDRSNKSNSGFRGSNQEEKKIMDKSSRPQYQEQKNRENNGFRGKPEERKNYTGNRLTKRD